MKNTLIILITFIGITAFSSCKKDTDTICENLLEQGTSGLTSLKGEWVFEKFAHTRNGKKINSDSEIKKGYINITDTGSIWFNHANTDHYEYELFNINGIIMNLKGSTFINPPQEEIEVSNAFRNSVCYVIDNNRLLLHFTKDEDKNILILNRK